MILSRVPARRGAARAVEIDGEVGLLVTAPDGLEIRVMLPLAAVFRLSSDLEHFGEAVLAAREKAAKQVHVEFGD